MSTCVSVTATDGSGVVALVASTAGALQALITIASAMKNAKETYFIFDLAIRIACILESYSVISYDYFPTLRRCIEGARDFEVLLATN